MADQRSSHERPAGARCPAGCGEIPREHYVEADGAFFCSQGCAILLGYNDRSECLGDGQKRGKQ